MEYSPSQGLGDTRTLQCVVVLRHAPEGQARGVPQRLHEYAGWNFRVFVLVHLWAEGRMDRWVGYPPVGLGVKGAGFNTLQGKGKGNALWEMGETIQSNSRHCGQKVAQSVLTDDTQSSESDQPDKPWVCQSAPQHCIWSKKPGRRNYGITSFR